MANPERRDDHAGQVEVRVLSEIYGGNRNPLGRRGDVIWVTREDYDSAKGFPSLSGVGRVGASLRLMSEEKAIEQKRADITKKSEDLHFKRREQFRAQGNASRDAALKKAEFDKQSAEAAIARIKQSK